MMGVIFKLVYTAVLLGLTGVLLREIHTIWFDSRVFIGRFDVISSNGKEIEKSQSFPTQVVAAQNIFARQLADYQSRRQGVAPTDTTYALPGVTQLDLPPEVLGGIDITVQDINVRQILTTMRRTFLAPNEIHGQVTNQQGAFLAAVSWPLAPNLVDGRKTPTDFLIPSMSSTQEIASYLACRISWMRAASTSKDVAKYSWDQFCTFSTALNDLYSYELKAAAGLDDNDVKRLRQQIVRLKSFYGAPDVLPELYRLRADLLELLPESKRTNEELVAAQDDRVKYAMLSPELSQLPQEERRMAALAIARPAILLNDGQLRDVKDNWKGLLGRYEENIRSADAATGAIITPGNRILGTGFLVSRKMMLTANQIFQGHKHIDPTEGPLRFCFGNLENRCKRTLEIGKVIYDGKADGSGVTLVEVSTDETTVLPYLRLAEPAADPGLLIGRYVYLIGYPSLDFRIPEKFLDYLLAKIFEVKRLMPGRILAFRGHTPDSGFGSRPRFTTDASTMSGTAGSPLIDLLTGAVIGVNYAGIWTGDGGKFAYSEALPPAVVEIVRKEVQMTNSADTPI